MSVRDSRHRVDLEVLVGADGGHLLDGTPVGEGRLSIVEPLVAQLLDVVGVDGGDSLSDLSSRDSAAELQEVQTDLLVEDHTVDLNTAILLLRDKIDHQSLLKDELDDLDLLSVEGETNTNVSVGWVNEHLQFVFKLQKETVGVHHVLV